MPNLLLEAAEHPRSNSRSTRPAPLRARRCPKAGPRSGSTATLVMINGRSAAAIGDGAIEAAGPRLKLRQPSRWSNSRPRLPAARHRDRRGASRTATPARKPTGQRCRSTSTGLNYVDAQLRLSAAELSVQASAHFAPVALEASLRQRRSAPEHHLEISGPMAARPTGAIDVDVSRDAPVTPVRGDLTGVRALPLLRSAADFDKLDGKLQATIDVRSTGQSQQRDHRPDLAGTVVANFQDGAIRGLNVAQMIRSAGLGHPCRAGRRSREQTTDLHPAVRPRSGSTRARQPRPTSIWSRPLVKVTGRRHDRSRRADAGACGSSRNW